MRFEKVKPIKRALDETGIRSIGAPDKRCENCLWYAAYEGVCCNGESFHAAEFMDRYDGCALWQARQMPGADGMDEEGVNE